MSFDDMIHAACARVATAQDNITTSEIFTFSRAIIYYERPKWHADGEACTRPQSADIAVESLPLTYT